MKTTYAMKLLHVILVIGQLSKYGFANFHCTNAPDCKVSNWESWSVCSGICGSQSHSRERYMCCDNVVKPHTIENCLMHCNLTASFPLTLSRPCRTCENGGRLNSSSLSCQCDVYHKGGCCQGKNCEFDLWWTCTCVRDNTLTLVQMVDDPQ